MPMRLMIAFCVILLTAMPASATSGEWVAVTCPVCANTFEGWEWHSTNSLGGSDRDFCRQARGGQAFLLACWTCPQCAYTGDEEDFDPEEMPKDLVSQLKVNNPLKPAVPIDPKTPRIDAIPAWVRWDLHIQVLDLKQDTTTEDRAWVRLSTAHTQRFEIDWPDTLSSAVTGLWSTYRERLPEQKERRRAYALTVAIARSLEADAGNAKLPLTPTERRIRLLHAARLFLSRGESPAAARVLATLRREHPKLPDDMQSLAADLEQRITRERKYLASALPHFEELTKEKDRDAVDRLAMGYLVGELYRKLGDHTKARAWLEPLLEQEIPDGLKTWVSEAIAKSKAATKD